DGGEGEHRVRHDSAEPAAGTLDQHVGKHVLPGKRAPRGEDERHSRVEMRARQRPEHGHEHHEDGAGRDGVAQEGDRSIPAGQPLGHDPGADDGCDQQARAEGLGQQASAELHAAESLLLPIESSCRCSDSVSSELMGRLTKIEIRFESMRNVSANASRTSASLPLAAAGSGTPQWAVIGWPGQKGEASPAALPQTVKTKFKGVAPGPLNSRQLFERTALTSKFILRRRSSAYGCRRPVGLLPAEWARKCPRPSRLRMASAMI